MQAAEPPRTRRGPRRGVAQGYGPGDPRDDAHIVRESLASELAAAKEAGQVGYMARLLAQATMPHRDPKVSEFKRSNGLLTLTIISESEFGIPYGGLARLILTWLTTEAVRTREPVLLLGPRLGTFMHQLDLVPTGGRWGTIPRFRSQLERVASARFSCRLSELGRTRTEFFHVARSIETWWDPRRPEQGALWQSTLTLSGDFFQEVLAHHFPVKMAVLRALRRSPLALDIYAWATWRVSFLADEVTIPWPALQAQFGAGYGRTRAFRENFRRALAEVLAVYPDLRVRPYTAGLVLRESATSVAPRPRLPGRAPSSGL